VSTRKAVQKTALAEATYPVATTAGTEAVVKEYTEALLVVDVLQLVSGAPVLELVVKTRPDGVTDWWTLLWKPTLLKESDGTTPSQLSAVGRYLLKVPGPLGANLRADAVVTGTGTMKLRAYWDCKS
jgi:hypothetical protein